VLAIANPLLFKTLEGIPVSRYTPWTGGPGQPAIGYPLGQDGSEVQYLNIYPL